MEHDDAFYVSLYSTLLDEMDSDDESLEKKGRGLYYTYMHDPKIVDELCLALCGWTFTTLMKLTAERMAKGGETK